MRAMPARPPPTRPTPREAPSDGDTVLRLMLAEPRRITVRALADAAGWRLASGEPHTSKATRALRKREADKLAEKTRRGPWRR
jgi:hypothetical protein